jgi:PAS domain-containing protein
VYRDTAGNVTGVFAAARDITGQKKAEEAIQKANDLLEKRVKERTADLAKSNVKLKEEIYQRWMAESQVEKTVSELYAAIESTADGIYAIDRDGKIIRYNQNFASMWKIPDSVLQSCEDHAVSGYMKTQVKNPGLFKDSDDAYNHPRDRETYDMLELRDGRIFKTPEDGRCDHRQGHELPGCHRTPACRRKTDCIPPGKRDPYPGDSPPGQKQPPDHIRSSGYDTDADTG